ncbi:hypothetical protein PSK29_24170 [Escherichia coli]|nr:hypothetical protein [Escherichia coli]
MTDDKVIEIYKTCVEMADRISDRRLKSNTFLLALNSSILPLVGYFFFKANNTAYLGNLNLSRWSRN